MKLRISTPEKEGIFQGSKWLKFQVLCDREELKCLFEKLEPFSIFPLTGMSSGKATEKGDFLRIYGEWIEQLKQGKPPSDESLRKLLAAVVVREEGALWLQEIPGKGYLLKVCKAVLHLQAHYFTYSRADGVFRPMSMGERSIFWGLQFSFPQIYQDGKTAEIKEAEENLLVKLLRVWLREETRPTPFLVDGKKVNVPIRLGKQCFSWIGRHPQLALQNIGVLNET